MACQGRQSTFPATPYAEVMSGGQPESLRAGVCGFSSDHTREKAMTTVVKQQDAIEIYVNEGGGITIRQTNRYEEDSTVCFGVEHAAMIVAAIEQCAIEARELAE